MYQLKKRILKPLERRSLYVVSGILWLTGTIWLCLRYCTGPQSPFGSSLSTMLLKIHGAAAISFLIILGILIHHIYPGWRRKKQRPSGASLLGTCGFLILTGWGLYYVGDERFRNWISIMHSILGLLLPVIIFFHVWNVYKRLKMIEKESGTKH